MIVHGRIVVFNAFHKQKSIHTAESSIRGSVSREDCSG